MDNQQNDRLNPVSLEAAIYGHRPKPTAAKPSQPAARPTPTGTERASLRQNPEQASGADPDMPHPLGGTKNGLQDGPLG
ncbi:MAG: hypothetical protein AAGB48_02690 [Planctomycetota bacterium]